jgi:hypothetical protein
MPPAFFFSKKKKKIQKTKNGWPATTYGVVRPPQRIFIYFFGFFFFGIFSFRKKKVLGAFWE